MPEFSDVLRQRLASREVASDHPDADILTAFSERLLPVAERDQILDHLARCRQCREVVSLSLTQMDATAAEWQAAIVAKAPRRAWARWFGLAGSLAAMAVVAMVIVKLPQQHRSAPTPQEQAKVEPLPEVGSQPTSAATPPAATNQKTAVPAPLPAKPARASEAATRTLQLPNHAGSVIAGRVETTTPPPPVLQTPRATVSTVSAIAEAPPRRDYVNDKIFSQNEGGRSSLADGELPTAKALDQNTTEPKSAQLSMFPADLTQPSMNTAPPKTVAAAPTPTSGHGGFKGLTSNVAEATKKILLHKHLPVQPGVTSFSDTMGRAGQFNPANEKGQAVEAESTTPAANAGSDLDQAGAFTPRALSTARAGFQPSWTVGDSKLLRSTESGTWIAGYAGTPSIDFSAVTAHGVDVWAGGNRATLIHSRDSGVNWERVRLGSNAAGSISSIAITGTNVRVTTSEGQTWSSDDGGKTWTQQ